MFKLEFIFSNHVEVKVTLERDSNGKFGISIRKGSNVINYISPSSPAALHGGIKNDDATIKADISMMGCNSS